MNSAKKDGLLIAGSVIGAIGLATTAIWVWIGTTIGCPKDPEQNWPVPSSSWSIAVSGYHCSALDHTTEITALDKSTKQNIELFSIEGEASLRVVVNPTGMVLLADRYAEVHSVHDQFGHFRAALKRVTQAELDQR
jgi:hypothetical protein